MPKVLCVCVCMHTYIYTHAHVHVNTSFENFLLTWSECYNSYNAESNRAHKLHVLIHCCFCALILFFNILFLQYEQKDFRRYNNNEKSNFFYLIV